MKFSHSLIKRLLPKSPAKAKLIEALNLHSFEAEDAKGDTIEVSLPSNRYSDAASHIGIAREAAAIVRLSFTSPVRTIINPPSNKGLLAISIQSRKVCPRYNARYFELNRRAAAPLWMQNVLKSCGIRPIHGLVDIMNYVMLETGQPLHVFDVDKVAAKDNGRATKEIIVRKARKGERIETLDGQRFELDPDMLVIADARRALAIAGVKGGAYAGVSRNTKRIIVEAANFDAASIYRTSRRLKLPTDAALRFSHGISPALVDWGADRAAALLQKAGATLMDSADSDPAPQKDGMIAFDLRRYESLIGIPVGDAEAKRVFRALGFSISRGKNPTGPNGTFLVRVPAWRNDIERFEDLAEEIARLRGYQRLKAEPPLISMRTATEEDSVVLKSRTRSHLQSLRFDEVVLHSFVPRASGKRAVVELENPLSAEFEVLRSDLEQGLLQAVRDNIRFADQVRIFEIGRAFSHAGEGVKEENRVGIVLAGRGKPQVRELKGVCDSLLQSFGIVPRAVYVGGDALRLEADHDVLGTLRPHVLEKGWSAVSAELSLDTVLRKIGEERLFAPLPKYPAVIRDLSVLIGAQVPIGDVSQAVEGASPRIIADVDLIDEYDDPKLGGKQSLTFRIVFQSPDRTLTDAEVNREMEKIVILLRRKFKAEVR